MCAIANWANKRRVWEGGHTLTWTHKHSLIYDQYLLVKSSWNKWDVIYIQKHFNQHSSDVLMPTTIHDQLVPTHLHSSSLLLRVLSLPLLKILSTSPPSSICPPPLVPYSPKNNLRLRLSPVHKVPLQHLLQRSINTNTSLTLRSQSLQARISIRLLVLFRSC